MSACCTLPPVKSDYAPTGSMETYNNVPVYVVGPKDAKKAVVVFYDIFGVHPNTQQFCDILANNCGWKVVLPDIFRGEYWSEDKMGDMPGLMQFISEKGSYEKVESDTSAVKEQLKKDGVEASTLVGFCWGAKMAIKLAAANDFFVGAALIHPSFLDESDFEAAKSPLLTVLTSGELGESQASYVDKIDEILEANGLLEESKTVKMIDMHHGFCAARGNYKDELNCEKANETIKLTVGYFTKWFAAKNKA